MTEPQVLNDAGVSDREAEVLALVGEHLTNAEIAARLFISVRTVESHVSALLRKLDLPDRRALADLAGRLTGASSPAASTEDAAPPAEFARPSPAPLPAPLTSFVGRAAERAALAEALARHRLVTAVGPGGVGKTRLALAVAADVTDRYRDGAWYVDLVPVTDPAMVGAAVAASLGFSEQLGRSPTETVAARMADAEALVVLDNCEHLVDGVVEFVERLLSGCPGVVVLATSQARLLVPFESVFPVSGLSLEPGEGDAAGDGSDAVALFLDRAAMAGWSPRSDEDGSRIVAICDALDGIALAIELAAARVAALGLDGLEAGLARPLGLLAGSPRLDERHRSVRSTVDWSYSLLGSEVQAVLRRAAVFAGVIAPDAAISVTGFPPLDPDDVATALARLADHSLLVVLSGPAGTRYRMLETIRQYGQEQLDAAGEQAEAHRRHLQWCLATATALDAEPPAATTLAADPQAVGGDPAFDAVGDDLRAALGWATGEPGHQADAHRLAVRLAQLTFARGMVSEAQRRYEDAAALAADDAESAQDLEQGAALALCRLAGDDALRLYLAAADAARRAGDDHRAARQLARAAEIMDRSPGLLSDRPGPERLKAVAAEARDLAGEDPHALAAISVVAFGASPAQLDLAQAERAIEVAQEVGDRRLESAGLDQLTVVQMAQGEVMPAAATARRRLELLAAPESSGVVEAAFEMSDALHMAALASLGAGDLPRARRYAQARLDLPFHQEDDYLVVNWLLVLAAITGDWDRVVDLSERFRRGWERAGRLPLRGFATAPAAAAMVHGLRGDEERRRVWLDMFEHMLRAGADLRGSSTGYGPVFDAILFLHRGEAAEAVAALAEDPEALTIWSAAVWRQWYAALWAEAAVVAGRPDRDERLARARELAAHNPVASAIVDRAEALARDDRPALLAAAAAFEAAECRYQQARTLVLAGGPERTEGERLLAAMHAIPMAT